MTVAEYLQDKSIDELQEKYAHLESTIEDVGCYRASDLALYEAVARELQSRGLTYRKVSQWIKEGEF